MTDPFRIDGPAVISFSGGRTSALLLRYILDAHGGVLPPDVFVVYANTGKEREETLRFILACSVRWHVPITWVERMPGPHTDMPHKDRAREVTFETASRKGEPFDQIIAERGMLPRPMIRFCSELLKQRTMRDWALALGWQEWTRIVGMRYDEPERYQKIIASGHEKGDVLCPLYTAKITEADVMAFWKEQSFDLGLKSYEGNCDLCMLKSQSKRVRILRDHPELGEWWLKHESGKQRFRPDNPSYATLARRASLPMLPALVEYADEGNDFGDCACTD